MKHLVAVAVVLLCHQVVLGDVPPFQISKASNSFANRFYEQVAKKPGNVLVCPISVHIVMGLILQGAGVGSTASDELTTVLGLSGANTDTKQNYKALLTSLNGNALKIVNKLYLAKHFVLNDHYLRDAQRYFMSDIELADYSNPKKAAEQINRYVEEHTNNKIHDLISPDSISGLTELIIINAVHFQDTWKQTFRASHVSDFHISPQEQVQTTFMSTSGHYFYKEDSALDAQVLELIYKGGDHSLLLVLPNKLDGLNQLEAKLVHTDLESLLKDLSLAKVDVTIPKFKLEYDIDLKDSLKSIGIKDIFSTCTDLSGIAKEGNLSVSNVIQKSFITVHENGTEAAAATGAVVVQKSSFPVVRKIFNADHPFHFMLIKEHTVLFKGRLQYPGTAE